MFIYHGSMCGKSGKAFSLELDLSLTLSFTNCMSLTGSVRLSSILSSVKTG